MSEACREGSHAKWNSYNHTDRYRARRIENVLTDPDCVQAWRNGHNGIDLEWRPAVGHKPIFVPKNNPHHEVETGDWLVMWATGNHVWPVTNAQALRMFDELAEVVE